MERPWKITFIILLAAVIILLLMNLRHKDDRIDTALRKLDSTKMLLDITRMTVDSSRKHLTDLQSKVSTYDIFLSSISSKVGQLNTSFQKNENDFNAKKVQAQKRYKQTKDSVMKYTPAFWPEIVIDTTR